jgi:hypothetical protein
VIVRLPPSVLVPVNPSTVPATPSSASPTVKSPPMVSAREIVRLPPQLPAGRR